MMRKQISKVVQLVTVAFLTACSTDPTTPNGAVQPLQPGQSLVGTLTALQPLRRTVPLSADVSVSATIGKEGGRISFPQAGFTLIVPEGAVRSNTKFAIKALSGSAVAYEFEPHGVVFRRSLIAKQELAATRLDLSLGILKAGYFPDRSLVSTSGTTALVSELIPGTLDLSLFQFRWNIDHFSGYIVAW